jgi:hypothetical protein
LDSRLAVLKIKYGVGRIHGGVVQPKVRVRPASQRIGARDEHLGADQEPVAQDDDLEHCRLTAQRSIPSWVGEKTGGLKLGVVDNADDFLAEALALFNHRALFEFFSVVEVDRTGAVALALNQPVVEVDTRWPTLARRCR